MHEIRLNRLEALCTSLIQEEKEETASQITDEIADIVIAGEQILIDGTQMEDGSVDPAHLFVDMDGRYYFNVYTSMDTFRFCKGVNPFVLPLVKLLEPIYAEESFGGLAINHKKGDPMVLISKEQIYDVLQQRAASAC